MVKNLPANVTWCVVSVGICLPAVKTAIAAPVSSLTGYKLNNEIINIYKLDQFESRNLQEQ